MVDASFFLTADIWKLHIFPYLTLQDLANLYTADHLLASHIETWKDWQSLLRNTYPPGEPEIGATSFQKFVTRTYAQTLYCLDNQHMQWSGDNHISSAKAVKAIYDKTSFAFLHISGDIKGDRFPNHSHQSAKIWEITWALHGTQCGTTSITAWSEQNKPPFSLDTSPDGVNKASCCGYFCSVLTYGGQIFWWHKALHSVYPTQGITPIVYHQVDTPVPVLDIVASRHGILVVGTDGDLYSITVLDKYFQPAEQVWSKLSHKLNLQSIEMVDDHLYFVITINGDVYLGDRDDLTAPLQPLSLKSVRKLIRVQETFFALLVDGTLQQWLKDQNPSPIPKLKAFTIEATRSSVCALVAHEWDNLLKAKLEPIYAYS